MTRRPCLDCGRPTPTTRCRQCNAPRAAAKDRSRASRHTAAYRRARRAVLESSDRCHLCGQPGADTVDHLVPASLGGPDTPDNLLPAHRSCNSSRGAALPEAPDF